VTAAKRRDLGRPRGKPIERQILEETLRELAEHGVSGLSIPRIAEAAQVNKTSIYRRWPTKEELVAAALEDTLRSTASELHDTGSLRGDLEQMLSVVAAQLSSPSGRALLVASMSEAAAAAVGELSGDPMVRRQDAAVGLVRRAAGRGEWDVERYLPDAVFAMLTGSAMHRLLLERQPLTEAWRRTTVEVLVRGVRPESAPAPRALAAKRSR
jgi:AcrR family transcriptional regulator